MKNKIIFGIAITIIIIMAIFAIYKNNQNLKVIEETERENTIQEEVQKAKKTINTKYQYKDGKNIFIGTIELENPCDKYTTEIKEENGQKEIIITTSPADEEESCYSSETQKTFRIEIVGEKDENILATLNGELVNLNIFTIPEDEDINEVDIYIKG